MSRKRRRKDPDSDYQDTGEQNNLQHLLLRPRTRIPFNVTHHSHDCYSHARDGDGDGDGEKQKQNNLTFHSKDYVNWKTLARDALITICSFCDLNDILAVRRTCSCFRSSARDEAKQRTSLSFSELAGVFKDHRVQSESELANNTKDDKDEDKHKNVKDEDQECQDTNTNTSQSTRHGSARAFVDYYDNRISQRLKKDKQEECVSTILDEVLQEFCTSTGTSTSSRYQHLDFCNLRDLVAPRLRLRPRHLEKLVTLDLSFCSRLEPYVLLDIVPTTSHPISTSNSNSNSNSLSNSAITTSTISMHTSTHTRVPPPLRQLYLAGCRKFKGDHVTRLTEYFTEIQVLHLSGCSQAMNDKSIIQICNHLHHNLESFDLSGFNRITDASSIAIFRTCKKLRYLNVNHCERLHWDFLAPFRQGLEEWWTEVILAGAGAGAGAAADEDQGRASLFDVCSLARSGDVHSLRVAQSFSSFGHLMDWDMISFQMEIADISFGASTRGGLQKYGLAALAMASFGRLREVNVSGSQIVNADVHVLSVVCQDSLKSLDVRCCDHIGDDSLRSISQYAKNLVNLDLSACINMTDVGVAELQHCERLTCLKMASLTSITNISISSFGSLSNLLVLDVHNCRFVTKEAIKELLGQLPLLVDVDARNIAHDHWKCAITGEDKKGLAIFNGKKCRHAGLQRGESSQCCSVTESSRRVTIQQGARPRRMYHCTECDLVPKFNQGMCGGCAIHCHKDHFSSVYMGAVTYYFCDCAFDFVPEGREGCKLLGIRSVIDK